MACIWKRVGNIVHFVHYFVGKYIILVINVDIFLKCIKQYRQHILLPRFLFLGGQGGGI